MAGRSRSVEFDLLVTGTEVGGQKVRRLGDEFDDLADKVDRVDGKTARVKGIAKIEKDSDNLSRSLAKLGGNVLKTGAGVLKFASIAGLAAGALGPLVIGVGIAAVAAAQFAIEMSGAAAALAPLAVGAIFVTQTLKAMGEEFLAAIEPVTKAWEKSTAAAANLATKGIKPLAREFVRANFPMIARAQERIGVALNRQLRGFVGWLNAAQGQAVIARLTEDTATAFEALAPAVREVAQSFVAMLGRISQISFNSVTDGLAFLLGKLSGFIDTIDSSDVDRGVSKLQRTAVTIKDAFVAIGNAIDFVVENKDKILQLSDAILVLTAVGAALAGGWIVALGASLILLARHWDDVTGAVQSVRDAFSGLGERFSSLQGTLDSFGVFWASVKAGFREFADQVGPRVAPMLERIQTAFIKAQPLISGVVTILGGLAKALLEIAGPVVADFLDAVGLMATFLGNLALGAAMAAEMILAGFVAIFQPLANLAKKLKLPFADAFQSFIDGANNAKNRMNTSIAQVKTDTARAEMDRLQRKVNSLKGKTVKTEADKRAIAESEARIEELIRTIYRIPNRSVTITTYFDQVNRGTRNASFGGNRATGGRALGGPVMRGVPYIVGENRPELFIPNQAGRIRPTVPTGWSGGGNTTIIIQAPNYVGDKRDLVKALDDLASRGRLPKAS